MRDRRSGHPVADLVQQHAEPALVGFHNVVKFEPLVDRVVGIGDVGHVVQRATEQV